MKTYNQQFFNSEVVQNHPKTAILKAEAWKRQRRANLFLIYLFVIALAATYGAIRNPNQAESFGGVVPTVLAFTLSVGLLSFILVNLREEIEFRDFLFWKTPLAHLDPVLEEIRDAFRDIGIIFTPDHDALFGLPLEKLQWYAHERSYWLTGLYLRLETELDGENLNTHQMLDARRNILEESRNRLKTVIARFHACNLLPPEKNLGYYFKSLKR